MAELWFIRHFRTPWNSAGRLQGRCDVGLDNPLSASDLASLRTNQAALKDVGFSDVWCSPLVRARQTAAMHGFEDPTIVADLTELDFGPFEGRLWSELEAAHPGKWRSAPQDLPLGESFDIFKRRVCDVLKRVATIPDGPVLIFGHGAWSGCMRCLHEGHDTATMAVRGLRNGELLRLVPLRRPSICTL